MPDASPLTEDIANNESQRPAFSVLLSLYQNERPEFFEECLQSVADQSWPPAEVVVVLDGPIGAELQSVIDRWRERLPLVVLPLPQQEGLGRALAHGLQHCRHELVVRVDTDDINQPWRFERQVGFMARNPQIAVCGSCMWEVEPGTLQLLARKVVPESDASIRSMLPYRNPFNHPTVVLRRSCVLQAGNYRHCPQAEDHDLWLRLLAQGGKGWNLQDDLVLARAGTRMLRRRRGWNYVKTEYRLYRLKRQLRVLGPLTAVLVFIARALPRLLPVSLLQLLYRVLRHS